MRWDTPRERLDAFDRVLEEIKRDSDDETVILVEGKRDIEALVTLDVVEDEKDGAVRVSGNGRSLDETVARVSTEFSEAILLTDWDSQGDALGLKLKELLESHGVVPRTHHRKRLRNLTSKDIHDVESLAVHRRNMRSEI
ncbi:MAG: hypothetical protein SV760_02845 [Halobacteria archaeon]|nr:hypothetical protein [Halobacteria archaeon]